VLAELAAARADEMDADTVNRELSIARKAIGWWQRQGWIECDFSQVTASCSAVVIWLVVRLGVDRRVAERQRRDLPAAERESKILD
jgi:hypothetical protein